MELFTVLGVMILGGVSAVVVGGVAETIRAFLTKDRRDAIRHRTARENLHRILS